jgi:multimeric flavodoxin WrbA
MSLSVVAFNGSPRPQGNTFQSLSIVLDELAKQGISGEILQVGGKQLAGCKSCYRCLQNKDKKCVQTGDEMNYFIERAFGADGILIGSPVYFSNVSSEAKAFIDRCGFVANANDKMLRGKVGAAVLSMRRAGATFAYSAINFFFGISEMIIPCSNYWNLAIGRQPGEVLQDAEGVATFKTLGNNMAALLKQLHSTNS